MNKRILWVDVAKAIGIYFIVLGHVLTTGTLRRWIFAFHVPLFFFLAGVTLKTNSTWMDFVKKKAKGLLIPYISFSFVSMAIYEVMVAFLVGNCVTSFAITYIYHNICTFLFDIFCTF